MTPNPEPLEQAPDTVPDRPLGVFGAGIAAAIVVSIVATLWLAGGDGAAPGAQVLPPPPHVDTAAYGRAQQAEVLRHAAERRLARYGWVDRDRGVVHVPLHVAIELYLREVAR